MDTPKLIGRYEIIEELGRGAMGTVYRAKDPAVDRVVAVKTIIPTMLAGDQKSEFLERFYREARTAGALSHPGIVAVYDVGEHNGSPFLVMEFISGQTLADALKSGQRLTLDRICEIGQKVAEALSYAAQHGVIHRDIKPANILLTSRESHGVERPKITDFGVAKLTAGQMTTTGQILGTPAFMAPEQFTGAPIDGRADLFSLGVVLYWMATGEQPFPGESITAVSYKVVHTEPPPPQRLNPSIPARLEAVIMKCLAKSPDDRYQNGDELARDLGDIRNRSTSTLQVAAPVVEIDSDATLKPGATAQATWKQAAPAQATVVSPDRKSKILPWVVAAAAVVVAVAVAGWHASHRTNTPAPAATSSAAVSNAVPNVGSNVVPSQPAPGPVPEPAATPTAASTPAPASNPTSATAPVPAPTPKPATASAVANKAVPAVAVKQTPPANAKLGAQPDAATPKSAASDAKAAKDAAKTDEATAEAAARAKKEVVPEAVDFDAKAMDPKANAKLKIKTDQMPAGVDLTLEMNGKIYWRVTTDKANPEYDDLFVPPGVQEFRVFANSGATRKTSNTVSADFKAKKKNNMKIELRIESLSAMNGSSQGLTPNTQLVVTLK